LLSIHVMTSTGFSASSPSTASTSRNASIPQTLGYGLTDSPAGQAAWIAEKF
jgi:hypothetical protein